MNTPIPNGHIPTFEQLAEMYRKAIKGEGQSYASQQRAALCEIATRAAEALTIQEQDLLCLAGELLILWEGTLILMQEASDEDASAVAALKNAHDARGQLLDVAAQKIVEATAVQKALDEAFAWARETFPAATIHSKAAHLAKEAAELAEHPDDPDELADVAMLHGHIVRLTGIDLAAAIRAKLAKNRTRTWGEPDAQGVVEHVRERPGE